MPYYQNYSLVSMGDVSDIKLIRTEQILHFDLNQGREAPLRRFVPADGWTPLVEWADTYDMLIGIYYISIFKHTTHCSDKHFDLWHLAGHSAARIIDLH